MTRLLDIIRCLLAAAVLGALLAGVPLVLYIAAGSPIPDQLPPLQEIWQTLSRRDDGTLFLALVRLIGWTTWALFVLATAIDVISRMRGRATPQLPGLGGVQWIATHLISAMALGISSPAVAAVAITPPVAVIAATVADAQPAAAQTTTSPDPNADSKPGRQAQTRPQQQDRPDRPEVHARSHTVQPGDCLWRIAKTHLGDGDRYPEIVQLNDRITDPSVIRPGWKLTVPGRGHDNSPAEREDRATPTDQPRPPAAEVPQQGHDGTSGRHQAHPSRSPQFSRPHPAATQAQATPSQPATASQPAPATASQPAPRDSPTTITLTSSEPDSDGGTAALPIATFAGGMLAGSLVTLAQLRHRQRQNRRRGRRIALPEHRSAIKAEQRLRSLATPSASSQLRTALAILATTDADLPAIHGVQLTETATTLLLAEPAPPPEPFTGDEHRWSVPAAAAPPHAPPTGELLPGLVTAGRTADGIWLINLEQLGVLGCSGPADLVEQLLTTIATELATNVASGWFDVLAVGFGELDSLEGRLHPCGDLDQALTLYGERARELSERLDGGTIAQRRAHGNEDEDWGITVLITRDAPSATQIQRLAELAASVPGGLAAVIPADPGNDTIAAWLTLTAGQNGPQLHIAGAGTTLRPQLLDGDSYTQLGQLFTIAATTDDVHPGAQPYLAYTGGNLLPAATGDLPNQSADAATPEPDDSPSPAEAPAGRQEPQPHGGVQISVMGPLELTGTDTDLQPKMTELLLAIALSGPAGLRISQLSELLGADPDHPKPADQVRQFITRTRAKLGKAPDGQPRITCDKRHVYRTHDVSLDWHHFGDLARAGGRGELRRALALVRGRPLEDCFHWWIEAPLLEGMRAEIVDAADLLAELELETTPAEAAKAARIGLTADRYAEQLWRALMRAEHALGNIPGVHSAWRSCLDAIAEVSADGDPHPDTAALYRQLVGGPAGAGRPPTLAYTGRHPYPRSADPAEVPELKWA